MKAGDTRFTSRQREVMRAINAGGSGRTFDALAAQFGASVEREMQELIALGAVEVRQTAPLAETDSSRMPAGPGEPYYALTAFGLRAM